MTSSAPIPPPPPSSPPPSPPSPPPLPPSPPSPPPPPPATIKPTKLHWIGFPSELKSTSKIESSKSSTPQHTKAKASHSLQERSSSFSDVATPSNRPPRKSYILPWLRGELNKGSSSQGSCPKHDVNKAGGSESLLHGSSPTGAIKISGFNSSLPDVTSNINALESEVVAGDVGQVKNISANENVKTTAELKNVRTDVKEDTKEEEAANSKSKEQKFTLAEIKLKLVKILQKGFCKCA